MPRSRPESPKTEEQGQADLFDEHFLKTLEYLYIVSKKVFAGRARAERRTRKVGSGIEFADYREYVPGDDLRYLDWNIYGRMDKLLLRLFEEEEDLYIYLLLDISDSMRMGSPPKLHYAMQITGDVRCQNLTDDPYSAVCYVPTRSGFSFISLDGMDSVNVVFSRWD